MPSIFHAGRLKVVLEDFLMPPGDFYAIYPDRHNLSAKVGAFVNFLIERLGNGRLGDGAIAIAAALSRRGWRRAVAILRCLPDHSEQAFRNATSALVSSWTCMIEWCKQASFPPIC
ncbi:MAG: hypothetical protein WDN04_05355 [Rhodospirillales bacterium]